MTGTGATLASGPLVEAPLELRLRSGGTLSKDSALVICPKCEAPCFIRRSVRITETVKHLTAHCTNSGCGHIFKAELAFVHSLVPGNLDRPDLDLAVCPKEEVVHVLPPSRGNADRDQRTMFDSG